MEDILKKLVAYPTIVGERQPAHQLLNYVEAFVTERGMFVKRFEWNGFESLVATVKPDVKTPKVMLAAHADVTPAPPEAFNLKSRNGRYYGRGVLDMKFALASYLQIIDEIQDDLQSYDLGLMVTTDEENGGRDGTAKLVDEGYIPQVCVLPDGGDNWQIQTAAKGMWAFEVSATGRTAHGSRPWLGDNALDKLLAGLNEIRAIFPKHLHPDTNTITLSQMRGGDGALNQVPHSASMMIDIRTINAKEHARIYEEVERICRKRKLSQRHISDGAPSECSLTDPYIAPFVKLVEKEVGITVHGYHALGSSDIRFFVPFGVPCISVYPLGGNIHADDEWINIRAFGQFKAVTRQYLEKVAHTKKQSPLLTAGV